MLIIRYTAAGNDSLWNRLRERQWQSSAVNEVKPLNLTKFLILTGSTVYSQFTVNYTSTHIAI